MKNPQLRLLIVIIALQPILLIAGLTFYNYGYKEYGEPAEYHKQQAELLQAIQDSVLAQQSVMTPENLGDSTMVGLEMHTRIFEESKLYDEQMSGVQTALDSLQKEKAALDDLSKQVANMQTILEDLRTRALDEKITSLAKIYDGMKPPQSVPLFTGMDDTLAVLIMSNMQGRNASKLLGAIAETDIDKATRITKLLAFMGVMKLE